ncbi:MAG TPA: phenylalanine--tRNA ligase subunit beta, partial [Candidatus Andersenbacteria bacterium]|nr:phenylalanine--tRNA ligase subunit beta [Candidatus Andersenbacteria bacterium]
MRVSYNWLRELLPGLTATPAEIAQQLTLHSFEAHAGLEQAIDPAVIVVKIIRLEAHPNADRLRLATIDTGQQEITVVCGAPNIAAGDIVPYAPPGTRVANAVGITTILRAAKIRGVQSPGMLASLRELGLGKDQAGIWLLPADTPIGTALATLIPADTILNLDLTPNRAHDCLSHVGVARELAALYDLVVSEPTLPPLPTILAGDITVDIENTAHCP